jgi:hypothetical protein
VNSESLESTDVPSQSHDWNKRLKASLWFGALPSASGLLTIEAHPSTVIGWLVTAASIAAANALVVWVFLRFLWAGDAAASYQEKMESKFRDRRLRCRAVGR